MTVCIASLFLAGVFLAAINQFTPQPERDGLIPDIERKFVGLLALAELVCWTMAGVGGIGWIICRRPRQNVGEVQTVRAHNRMTPSEVEELVRMKATGVLQIPAEEFNASIIRQLLVAPADLIQFLDDLHLDHGLPISSDDRKKFDTVEELVRLLTSRMAQIV